MNDRKGVWVYYDGKQVGKDTSLETGSSVHDNGNGRIAVGRRFAESDQKYASVQLDELLFFNQALTERQVTMLGKTTISETPEEENG